MVIHLVEVFNKKSDLKRQLVKLQCIFGLKTNKFVYIPFLRQNLPAKQSSFCLDIYFLLTSLTVETGVLLERSTSTSIYNKEGSNYSHFFFCKKAIICIFFKISAPVSKEMLASLEYENPVPKLVHLAVAPTFYDRNRCVGPYEQNLLRETLFYVGRGARHLRNNRSFD